MTKSNDAPGFQGTFDATTLRQSLLGLELTPAQRLRWLEERMAELFRICGKAATHGHTAGPGREECGAPLRANRTM